MMNECSLRGYHGAHRPVLLPLVLTPMLLAACASGPDPEIAEQAAKWRPIDHGGEPRQATVNGVELAYLEAGSGAALLLVHGAMASKDCWHHQIARFDRDFHVVAPDLRGHGDSHAGTDPHTAELHAADMVALMDRLSIRRFVVCGHSMGGFVAQTLALDYPDRVQAVVLADTSYGITTTLWERTMNAFARLYMRSASASALVKTFADQAGKHDPRTRAYLYAAMSRYVQDKDLIMQIWHAVEAFESKERLEKIAQPTLIVSPAANRQAWAQAKHMERAIPRAQRVVVQDAGHMVMLDNPSGFNAVLADFLSVAMAE
jgi:pimeloyl-ACP methyl ester carboxylesterase